MVLPGFGVVWQIGYSFKYEYVHVLTNQERFNLNAWMCRKGTERHG
jgi:hypothetical protein